MQSLRHGYTNDTRGDGSVVVKRYEGPDQVVRHRTEQAMLTHLSHHLPVPRLVRTTDAALHMEHVAGVHGQELIDAGQATRVLRSCGEMLRRIQSVAVPTPFPEGSVLLEGSVPADAVLVHGDYGPNNMLFDPDTFDVTAVLDWEWAHAGDIVEDLAWCEWIVRTHHSPDVAALDELFAAYGHRPSWTERQDAMLAKCRAMLALVERGDQARAGVRRWQQRIAVTLSWTE
ncbi:phosphotransferase family protein [Actinopolymorpha pittospori]|uniref:Aminoglycoside phosphotransferase n=1 Tax=Actinopolymorpha pittospori TaxID=648752 RepID=A0A927NBX9_9ACTN|nr:phosphotransferase [Actinopolymorpha pittospori]MBE1611995.1 aminoglycoside phosphotransferase [Actinopolymorpha pittospori]